MTMLTVDGLEVPEDVFRLESFRQWVSAQPESGPRMHYCQGKVWVEMSPQHHRTHGPVVLEINRVLATLARESGFGRYYAPPSWITDLGSGLSTEPDGYLVRTGSFRSGRIRINDSRPSEMIGVPDMTLEVVSDSSVGKDLGDLVEGYARAGVSEYWIVDARSERIDFRILLLGEEGSYRRQSADAEGWIPSPLWARAFRLERFRDAAGEIDYRLEHRPF